MVGIDCAVQHLFNALVFFVDQGDVDENALFLIA